MHLPPGVVTGDPAAVVKVSRTQRVAQMKERIVAAAAALFAEKGFIATGVRDIARIADVDPALVIRYFGSKEGLFLQTMVLPEGWSDVLAGPLESLAEDYMRFILDIGRAGDGGAILAALVRTSDRPEVADVLRSHTQTIFEHGVLPRLDGPDARLRAHLFAAGMTGLQVALWVADDRILVDAGVNAVVAIYAPALQRILTPH